MTKTFDLATLFERDEVKRGDGTVLNVRHTQELSILQRHQLDALIDRISLLDAQADKTEEDAAHGSQLLHDLAAVVIVDAPDDLQDWECAAIFGFWLAQAQAERTPPPSPGRKKTKPASSRGSKRSTAATRKAGSTSRRGS